MAAIIHKSLNLHCTTNRAFELFTVNSHLEKWLTLKADVEPIVGGKYELFWDMHSQQDNSTLGCKITAIDPPHFLSFEWKSPVQFKHFANEADPLTHVTVMFSTLGEQTRVHLLHTGWRKSVEWTEARVWQERAWEYAFNALFELTHAETSYIRS